MLEVRLFQKRIPTTLPIQHGTLQCWRVRAGWGDMDSLMEASGGRGSELKHCETRKAKAVQSVIGNPGLGRPDRSSWDMVSTKGGRGQCLSPASCAGLRTGCSYGGFLVPRAGRPPLMVTGSCSVFGWCGPWGRRI